MQIHYTARFGDGIVFDSSYKRGRPLTMRIGVGKVDKFLVAVNFFGYMFLLSF
jgi:peptidylprolyl isomerase